MNPYRFPEAPEKDNVHRILHDPPPTQNTPAPQHAAAAGLAQTFGLDVRAAVLTMGVDVMLFGGEVVTAGAFVFLSIAIAAVLGFIVYKIQTKWYHDDHDGALIKAMIVGLLTAIPAPLSPLLAIPGGFLGIVHWLRRKASNN